MKRRTQYWLSPHMMFHASLVLAIPFVLLVLANLFGWGWLSQLDATISLNIIESQSGFLTPLFIAITQLGGIVVTISLLIVIGLYLYRQKKRLDLAIWFILTVALGAGALNQFFKFLFKRSRPAIQHLVVQGGYSFPSGHSMGSIILYGAIVFLIVRLGKKKSIKWATLFIAILIIGAIGISRIYLGVHYPSDVIGGYSLGAAWLTGCIGMYSTWENRIKRKMMK